MAARLPPIQNRSLLNMPRNRSTGRILNVVLLLLTLVLLLLTPAVPWQNSIDTVKHAGDEDDIHEAIIRRQVESWYHEETTARTSDATEQSVAEALNFKVIFVEIDGRDPNKEFLKRLQDIPRIIKKKSDSKIHRVSVAWLLRHPRPILDTVTVVDKATRQPGIIFSAYKIHWLGEDSVEVEGGYYCASQCAGFWLYRLQRESGKWIIKSEAMTFQS